MHGRRVFIQCRTVSEISHRAGGRFAKLNERVKIIFASHTLLSHPSVLWHLGAAKEDIQKHFAPRCHNPDTYGISYQN